MEKNRRGVEYGIQSDPVYWLPQRHLQLCNKNDIYTINGIKVRENATSVEGLPEGIDIFKNKKYMRDYFCITIVN